jgi:hypothetical protein
MSTSYLYAKFHMSSSSDKVRIATKPRANYKYHAAAILLFYNLPKQL